MRGVLLLILCAVAVATAQHNCVVFGYLDDVNCVLQSHYERNMRMAKAPVRPGDRVYPSFDEALRDCPFSPTSIQIYGSVPVVDEMAFYPRSDPLIVRGVTTLVGKNTVPAKLVWFGNLNTVRSGVNVTFEGLTLNGCGSPRLLLQNSRATRLINTIVQNYVGPFVFEQRGGSFVAENVVFKSIRHGVLDVAGADRFVLDRVMFIDCLAGPAKTMRLDATTLARKQENKVSHLGSHE